MKHLLKIRYILLLVFSSVVTSLISQNTEQTKNIDVQFLAQHVYEDSTPVLFIGINTHGNLPDSLFLEIYDNELTLSYKGTRNLLSLLDPSRLDQTQTLQVEYITTQTLRLKAVFRDEIFYTPYYKEGNSFVYMSDLSYKGGSSYGTIAVDQNFEKNGKLNIKGQQYQKGFGIHANGWLEMNLPLDVYDRFSATVGKQNGKWGNFEWILKLDSEEITRTGVIDYNQKGDWSFPLKDKSAIRLEMTTGTDGNGSDHGVVGAPRFYYKPIEKKLQTITWDSVIPIHRSEPFQYKLEATTTSGLEPIYRLISGYEYATITDDNFLDIHTLPTKDSILIEAFQPGDSTWSPATSKITTLIITNGLVVQKKERLEIQENKHIHELIVYGDAYSCGQIDVKKGLFQVDKLILKYSFTPNEWQPISFPVDMNLENECDLEQRGFPFQANESITKGYQIAYYDSSVRSSIVSNASNSPWIHLTNPQLEAYKGYLMKVVNPRNSTPIEVTFTFDNLNMDIDSRMKMMDLTMDFTHVTPHTEEQIYIKPQNVKGNTLKVTATFDPENLDELPINYAYALENARITYTPNRLGLRLTLPDSSEAKVAIYNSKLKKLKKAVRYISPMMIDISDLKKGNYKMIVSYGGHLAIKEFVR